MPTIIVSDLHLGCRYCQWERFNAFLDTLPPDADLVLNGDTVDRRYTPFPVRHRQTLERIQSESRRRRVIWIRGNHDARFWPPDPVAIHFAEAHAIGSRLFVTHGHAFYNVTTYYRLFVRLLYYLHALRIRMGAPSVHIALYAKKFPWLYRILKRQVALNAIEFARENGYQTVVCGHVHDVEDFVCNDIRYLNTGSWTEPLTAAVYIDNNGATLKRII